jgi:hypothetical protein
MDSQLNLDDLKGIWAESEFKRALEQALGKLTITRDADKLEIVSGNRRVGNLRLI